MAQSSKWNKKVCVLVYVALRVQDSGDQSGNSSVKVWRSRLWNIGQWQDMKVGSCMTHHRTGTQPQAPSNLLLWEPPLQAVLRDSTFQFF